MVTLTVQQQVEFRSLLLEYTEAIALHDADELIRRTMAMENWINREIDNAVIKATMPFVKISRP